MRERDIESHLVDGVGKLGGVAFKFTSPSNSGVPDRIAVLPGGQVWFIELKTDKGRVAPLQKWQQGILRELGCNVSTLKGLDEVKAWLREVADSAVYPT